MKEVIGGAASVLLGFDFEKCVPWRRAPLGREVSRWERGDEGGRKSKQDVSGILLGCLPQGMPSICIRTDVKACSLYKLETWLMH